VKSSSKKRFMDFPWSCKRVCRTDAGLDFGTGARTPVTVQGVDRIVEQARDVRRYAFLHRAHRAPDSLPRASCVKSASCEALVLAASAGGERNVTRSRARQPVHRVSLFGDHLARASR
jgi:hypothetical protein